MTAHIVTLDQALDRVQSRTLFWVSNGITIERVQDGIEPALVIIDGFLTEGKPWPDDWLDSITRTHPGNACYYVRWESSHKGQFSGRGIRRTAAGHAFNLLSRSAGVSTSIANSLLEPWARAMLNAEKAGGLLADAIARTTGRYILCGHSLGARVAHYAMLGLSNIPQRSQIVEAHLLGGAVGNLQSDWQKARCAVSGKVYNYYSDHDEVLKLLYKAGTVFRSSPIGRHPIPAMRKIENHDVTDVVGGHGEHKKHFYMFMAGEPGVAAKKSARKTSAAKKAAAKKVTAKTITVEKIARKKPARKVAKKAIRKSTKAARRVAAARMPLM